MAKRETYREREWSEEKAYSVFDAVASPAEGVVFEVQELEAGVDVFDELADLEGPREVAECHGVGC